MTPGHIPYEVRADQLSDLSTACRRLAAILMIRGEAAAARTYAAKAVRAEELLAHGFAQPDLDALGASFPDVPAWITGPDHPEPWQEEAARVREVARDAARVLRA